MQSASAGGDEWATSGHDDYLLDHWREPAREIGLALGRTTYAVRGRRVALRRLRPDDVLRVAPDDVLARRLSAGDQDG